MKKWRFRGFWWKNGGFTGFMVENRGFSGKWWFFWKMGFSWVFGQEFGENKERAGNLMIS